MNITKEWLKPHSPCADGYGWFLKNFPQGAPFSEVYAGLRADRRYADSDWLVEKAFIGLPTVDQVRLTVTIAGADKAKIAAQVADDGANPDASATTGYRANSATTGEGANSATTGEGANSATTGYRANSATTGEGANSATTGNYANSATTGEGANSATTGNYANSATTGEKTISAALGLDSTASAGPDGAIVLAYFDEGAKRPRVVVAYVGEGGILPGTTYRLNDKHEFIAA
jgi:hypothetical protein